MEGTGWIRERLKSVEAEVFLGSNAVNRRYLTGFTGSAGFVWITQDEQALLTDFRYIEQAKAQCPGWKIIKIDNFEDILGTMVEEKGIKSVAFEGDHITVHQLEKWKEKVPVEFKSVTGWVQELRMVKNKDEIIAISRAAEIGDEAFAEILGSIRSGMSEKEAALELEFAMRRLGADGMSFDPIVASGPNSALPHARPSERIFSYGDFVVFDFGCIVDGYCSDMTRTVVIGEPDEKHILIYDLVLQAQMKSLAEIAPGKTGMEIDAIARDIISDGGYGRYFGHGLGHGVGLEIHERPRLSKTDDTVLEAGMVVTVEPGIYLPDFGGVRIEDLVLVTENGFQVLTSTFKELYVVE
ncbi:MAG: aminopeptidase P family protein [Firmicutes bacterium]|nr:aminopeptidase P family protein [Bacillota bacterium]